MSEWTNGTSLEWTSEREEDRVERSLNVCYLLSLLDMILASSHQEYIDRDKLLSLSAIGQHIKRCISK